MARFHATAEGLIPFTLEEEDERDAEEAAWISGEINRQAHDIRKTRDKLLTESDWIVAKSFEVGATVEQHWIEYRKKLRDIPQQPGFPKDVVWPQPPA